MISCTFLSGTTPSTTIPVVEGVVPVVEGVAK